MEKSLKKVKINLEKGTWIYEFDYVPLQKNWLEVQPLFEEAEYGLLIERKHEFQQSQLILSRTSSCWILAFDEDGILVSIKKHTNDGSNRPMSYLIPELYIVLISVKTTLLVNNIISLEIMPEKPIIPQKTPQLAIITLKEGGEGDLSMGGDKFPYIITRIMPALYKKTFIRFNFDLGSNLGSVLYVNPNILPEDKSINFLLKKGLLDNRLKELTISFANNRNDQEICLVLQENRCFYYVNKEFTETDQLPCGGTLIVGNKRVDIADMGKHY